MLQFRQSQPKNNHVKFCHGFTLIEIVVAIGLSVILLTALYSVYVTSYQSYRRSVQRAELDQNARISLERITRDLRQTNQIVTTLPTTNSDPLNPAPNEIMFQDGHNTSKIQYIDYSLSNNSLYRSVKHYYFSIDPTSWVYYNSKDQYNNLPLESVDENAVKADKVTSLQFFGTDVVNIIITVSDGTSQMTYKTQTLTRNNQ